MLLTLARLFAYLPLPLAQALGRLAGRLIYALPGKYRERLHANAAQAGYPAPAFARRAAAEIGAMILELPRVWFRNAATLAQVISDDDDVVRAALAEGKGILFLTPHLGNFDVAARHTAQIAPMTVMFRPPRKPALAPLLEAARNHADIKAVPATMQGVRDFVRTLRAGGTVGLLPDQAPGVGDGVWAPFFGKPAWTMTLPGKLAVQTGVAVILSAGERLPGSRGWRVHHLRIPTPLPIDPAAQAALLNRAMETLIRRFPEQYLWGYNRYKTPAGAPPGPQA